MAQDILITPQATTPTIAYTGNGGGAVTVTQKVLSDSRIQFDDGSVLFEINPIANAASATNFIATSATIASATAQYFIGNGSYLTNVTAEWDGSHTGAATITGTLLVNGTGTVTATTVNAPTMNTGAFDASGNATIDGTLTLNGTLDAGGEIAHITTCNVGTFDASGNATIDGTLTMNGNISAATKTLTIGTVTATTVNVPTLNTGTFDVSGNATIDGTLTMNGNISAAARTLTIGTVTATTVNVPTLNTGTFDVSGNATIDGTLTMNGNISAAARTLTIGTVNATTVTGTTITGTTVNAPTLNGGALDVSGNAVVDGTLNVVGNVSGAFFYGDGSNLTNIAATAIDHGALAGRADDDHTQYIINAPANGTRNVVTAGTGAGLTIKGPSVPLSDQILFLVEANGGSDLFSVDAEGDAILAGSFKANSKSFLIDHPDPAKVGWKLQYTCLEGPENGVYTRGRSQSCCIDLPDHWPHLVHEDSLSVHITPFGNSQMTLKVSEIRDNKVFVEAGNLDDPIDFFYIVYATRKDIPLLVIEHEPVEDGK